MKTVLIGCARMGSTRQPGKVMKDLGGKPVIQWVVDAARKARLVDDIIIATTVDPRDDIIVEWCRNYEVRSFRGSVNDFAPGVNDLLLRVFSAAEITHADVIVRATCDCPFLDPTVIDQVIALRETTGADYACNTDPPTWPDGLDCEALTIEALTIAHKEATTVLDRNSTTSFIYHNRNIFKCETLICPLPGMHKERWVLDTENDYEFCKAIAESKMIDFGWLNIKRLLDNHPHLRKLNAHHPRNERFYEQMTTEPLTPRTYERSKGLLARAEQIIPLGTQTFSKSKIQYPSESPLYVTHGDGGYCYDVDGNRFVDLVGGLLPVILGHRDPDVDYAVRRQLNNGCCFSLATELEIQLSETLCRLIPCAEMVRFGKNGTDVTTAAVRLARACTDRSLVVSSGYHGWADWAIAREPLRNLGVPYSAAHDVATFEYGSVTDFVSVTTNRWANIACVIVEPETNQEFLFYLRDFCNKTGAILIFDEVITGFRFAMGGAQKLCGVTPDLATFGKSMANGYPISALVGKREYMRAMEDICFSGTFFSDPVAIAAAIATIEKLEREDVLTKIADKQHQLLDMIPWSLDGAMSFYGYIGGLPRIKFEDNDIKTLFIQEMAQQGVLIIGTHNLSYAHGDNEIERVAKAYQHVLPLLAEAIKSCSVKQLIKGRSIPSYANVRAS